VASVVDPSDYDRILDELTASGGCTSLALRFDLAQKAFAHTALYDRTIADYLGGRAIGEVSSLYRMD